MENSDGGAHSIPKAQSSNLQQPIQITTVVKKGFNLNIISIAIIIIVCLGIGYIAGMKKLFEAWMLSDDVQTTYEDIIADARNQNTEIAETLQQRIFALEESHEIVMEQIKFEKENYARLAKENKEKLFKVTAELSALRYSLNHASDSERSDIQQHIDDLTNKQKKYSLNKTIYMCKGIQKGAVAIK